MNLTAALVEWREDTMAPVSPSLETDYPGMGGFVYKDLYNSLEGKYIDYFN